MTKKIKVGEFFALVDDQDYERLSAFNWQLKKNENRKYARRCLPRKEAREKKISRDRFMHHEILGVPPKGFYHDHINCDGLDNRRENLRICDNRLNQGNSRKRAGTSSKYKGVSVRGKFIVAQIKVFGSLKYLGSFETEEAAALAYNTAAKEVFGEFARLNEVQG